MINGVVTSEDTISVIINCKPYTIKSDNPNYNQVLEAIRVNDEQKIASLINLNTAIQDYEELFSDYIASIDANDEFKVDEYSITFNGTELDDYLVNKLKDVFKLGLKEHVSHYINFVRNLYKNPSYQSISELFRFLDRYSLPITEDGHFIAYKSVTNDYLDKYTKKVSNKVGDKNSMPRNMVDDNRNVACSTGYHVGAWGYSGKDGSYNTSNDRVMLVKVNPEHAVSVPSDSEEQKLRVCEYEVIGEYQEDTEIDCVIYDDEVIDNEEVSSQIEEFTFVDAENKTNKFIAGNFYQFRYLKYGYLNQTRVVKIMGEGYIDCKYLICEIQPGDVSYVDNGSDNIRKFLCDKISDFQEANIGVTRPATKNEFTVKTFTIEDKYGIQVGLTIGNTYSFVYNNYHRTVKIVNIESFGNYNNVHGELNEHDPMYEAGSDNNLVVESSEISFIELYKEE